MVAEGIVLWSFSSKRGESGILSKCEEIFPLLCRHAERALQGALSLRVFFAPHTMVIPESSQQLQDNALKEKLNGLAAYLTRR